MPLEHQQGYSDMFTISTIALPNSKFNKLLWEFLSTFYSRMYQLLNLKSRAD